MCLNRNLKTQIVKEGLTLELVQLKKYTVRKYFIDEYNENVHKK